jgi:hypothetical protein
MTLQLKNSDLLKKSSYLFLKTLKKIFFYQKHMQWNASKKIFSGELTKILQSLQLVVCNPKKPVCVDQKNGKKSL